MKPVILQMLVSHTLMSEDVDIESSVILRIYSDRLSTFCNKT